MQQVSLLLHDPNDLIRFKGKLLTLLRMGWRKPKALIPYTSVSAAISLKVEISPQNSFEF